ncbi:MAG: hypothetical protein NZZ41_02415 [Candidatus Dojkabacteria bacterium]|nr:hypothetical protein [Candidatus Dojkabacteria bacterium]
MLSKGIILSPPVLVIDESVDQSFATIFLKNNTDTAVAVNIEVHSLDILKYVDTGSFVFRDITQEQIILLLNKLELDKYKNNVQIPPSTTQNFVVNISNLKELKYLYPVIQFNINSIDNIQDQNNLSISYKFYSILVYKDKLQDEIITQERIDVVEFLPLSNFGVTPSISFRITLKNQTDQFLQPIGYIRVYNPYMQYFEKTSIINEDLEILFPKQQKEFVVTWDNTSSSVFNFDIGKFTANLFLKDDYSLLVPENLRGITHFYVVPIFSVLTIVILVIFFVFVVMKIKKSKVYKYVSVFTKTKTKLKV